MAGLKWVVILNIIVNHTNTHNWRYNIPIFSPFCPNEVNRLTGCDTIHMLHRILVKSACPDSLSGLKVWWFYHMKIYSLYKNISYSLEPPSQLIIWDNIRVGTKHYGTCR